MASTSPTWAGVGVGPRRRSGPALARSSGSVSRRTPPRSRTTVAWPSQVRRTAYLPPRTCGRRRPPEPGTSLVPALSPETGRYGDRREVGPMTRIDPSAWVAPSAVVTGDVTIGGGSRVLHGAVLNGDGGRGRGVPRDRGVGVRRSPGRQWQRAPDQQRAP